ncbi:MAG: hypothetical protein ACI91F_002978, partial [Candidatus Binatia bacterium]
PANKASGRQRRHYTVVASTLLVDVAEVSDLMIGHNIKTGAET